MFRANTSAVVIKGISPLLFGLNSPVDHTSVANPGMCHYGNLKTVSLSQGGSIWSKAISREIVIFFVSLSMISFGFFCGFFSGYRKKFAPNLCTFGKLAVSSLLTFIIACFSNSNVLVMITSLLLSHYRDLNSRLTPYKINNLY